MWNVWMSHVTHSKESCHTYKKPRHAYDWVMSHIWTCKCGALHIRISPVTHMNKLNYTYEWAMFHTNQSFHTYEWVMSHIWFSHVAHMIESCHTYERAMSHIWIGHVTHMN